MATATPSWGVINPGKHPDTLTGRRGLFIGARDRERMGIDISELYREELASLNKAVDMLGIPADVFGKYGVSYLKIVFEQESERIVDSMRRSGEAIPTELIATDGNATAEFECLCKSAPHIPRRSISSISLAYGTFLMMTKNGKDMSGLDASGGSEMTSLRALMSIAMTRGAALGNSGLSEGVLTIVQDHVARKKMLSDAASKIHVENRAAKADVFAWLDANFSTCTSMDDAARKAERLVPHTFRTVRDWVGQWKKLRSAGTP